MKNQFFYTRKETIANGAETRANEEPIIKEYLDSINLEKVIRSVQMDDDNLVVLLDDIHERTTEVPNINLKTNRVVGVKKQTQVFQTEVYLHGEDIARFRQATQVE